MSDMNSSSTENASEQPKHLNFIDRAALKWIARNTKGGLRNAAHSAYRHSGTAAAIAAAALVATPVVMSIAKPHPEWSEDPRVQAALEQKTEDSRIQQIAASINDQQRRYGVSLRDIIGETRFYTERNDETSFVDAGRSMNVLLEATQDANGQVLCKGPDEGGWFQPVKCADLAAARKEVDRLSAETGIDPGSNEFWTRPIGVFNGKATCTHRVGEPAVVCEDLFDQVIQRRNIEACLTKINPTYRWDAESDDGSISATRATKNRFVQLLYVTGKTPETVTRNGNWRSNKVVVTSAPYTEQVESCRRQYPTVNLRTIVLPRTPPGALQNG
ncbi:MAG TPA: hypothetical protein VFR09_08905 [Alphaproteobacteria bacterium]|nr:hypothetical protein [Alphaproteobacteria bacterium]